MKKVTGEIYSRPIGSFRFEYYVPDDMASEEIESFIMKKTGTETCFDVEEGYEEVKHEVTEYKKKEEK